MRGLIRGTAGRSGAAGCATTTGTSHAPEVYRNAWNERNRQPPAVHLVRQRESTLPAFRYVLQGATGCTAKSATGCTKDRAGHRQNPQGFHKGSTGRSTSLRQPRSTEALYGRTRVGKAGRYGVSRPRGERAQNAAEAVERRNLEQRRQRRPALRQESITTRSHGQARTWPGGGKRRAKTNRCASSRSRLRTAPWRPANCSLGPSGQCGHAEQHQRPPLSLGRSRMR